MENKILKIAVMGLAMSISLIGIEPLGVHAYNVRPGSHDEDVYSDISAVEDGWMPLSVLQELLDSGAYSEAVAPRVQEAINRLSGASASLVTTTTDNTSEKENAPVKAEHIHDYSGATTIEATCTDAGEITYTCSICKDSYTVPVDAVGHDYSFKITTTPTCTEKGIKTYTCAICEDTKEEEIGALGHTEGKREIGKEATCIDVGEKKIICAVCGLIIETEEISEIGHKLGKWEMEEKPTLIVSGSKVEECAVCGEILQRKEISSYLGQIGVTNIVISLVMVVIAIGLIIVILKKRGKRNEV